jgi:hypothetical protein
MKKLISLYSINWLLFVMGTQCIPCELGTEYWFIILMNFVFHIVRKRTVYIISTKLFGIVNVTNATTQNIKCCMAVYVSCSIKIHLSKAEHCSHIRYQL